MKKALGILLLALCCSVWGDYLDEGFAKPPMDSKPQTWWHWMNCNITKEGISEDIDAMYEAGIGGFTILDIMEGIPEGKVKTTSPEWFAMIQYAIEKANTLGMEVCIHNCPGWSSSGGPWVKKENAMKRVTFSEAVVEGGKTVEITLPRPKVIMDFYKEIAVLAFPTPADDTVRIPNIAGKAYFDLTRDYAPGPVPSSKAIILKESIVNLTKQMQPDGKLVWNAPMGNWTVVRFGFTLTGRYNHPTTSYGRGLECDKMSKTAVKNAWDGMMGIIVSNAGELSGNALKGSLIDSYEVGAQNWTDSFAEDFQRYRGYDVIPLLPILTGRYVDSQEYTERFLDDYRRTVSDLFAECYAEYFKSLCHEAGLDFFSEPYGGPFDELLQGRYTDVPMGEFWGGSDGTANAILAGNLAQVHGRQFASTETFTATPTNGRWQMHPALRKIQGDNAYIAGVNRFIFHSYAHQPWTVSGPGMTMGQWGFHFNRHNTLWKTFPAWLAYLARAQFMLQQGQVVSDALYVASEKSPSSMTLSPGLPRGYHGNCVDTRTLLEDVEVNSDRRVTLPSGMTFQLLIASQTSTISVNVLKKLNKLVLDGATVLLGPKPSKSLGLTNYPACDIELAELAEQLWGDLDGKTVSSRPHGLGTVFYGISPQDLLKKLGISPDFQVDAFENSTDTANYLHRRDNKGADWYFINNPQRREINFTATFRIANRIPELWDAETGKCMEAPDYECKNGMVKMPIRLSQSGSIFVVFRKPAKSFFNFGKRFTQLSWTSENFEEIKFDLTIQKAEYNAIDGAGGKDVTDILRKNITPNGTLHITAKNENLGGDPAHMHYKQLVIDYTLDGKQFHVILPEHATLEIPSGVIGKPQYDIVKNGKKTIVTAWENGVLTKATSQGKTQSIKFEHVIAPMSLEGPWTVAFPQNHGAPAEAIFPQLISYTDCETSGIRYFSGTSTYSITFKLDINQAESPVLLDLGTVMVNARVIVNNKDFGILWKAPYRTNISSACLPGKNVLKVEVTNRWINRIIGDEQLPPDAEWNGVRLKSWPQWFIEGKPSPTGRLAFTTWHHWNKDDALVPAGLIGPVKLYFGQSK